jgi:RNA polymerase sigma-70 factor (ECF subfamily)
VEQRTLVERARRGDHDAFALLATASVGRLLGTARLILRDPELAHDATQDALLRAWRDLPALRDPDRFEAWIRRLTVNACLDLARRRTRRPIEVEIAELEAPPVPAGEAAVEDRETVDAALRRLDPVSRAVVVLHFYHGLSLPEVGATLALPLGTVKTRLYRGLAAMRASIDQDAARPAGVGEEASA